MKEERFDMGSFRTRWHELGIGEVIPWPEKYGGIGSDYLAYCIAVEELSRVCASTGVTLSAHTSLAGWPIYTFGTEEQKQTYLKPLAEGKRSGHMANRAGIRFRCRRNENNSKTRWRPLYHQRLKDFHYKRRHC